MAATSFQQNKKCPAHFVKDHPRSLSYLGILFLSLILMYIDINYQYLGIVRKTFSVVISPLQYTVDYPVRLINKARLVFRAKKELLNENIRLRYQQALLTAELQNLLILKEENSQLSELLLTSAKTKMQTMAAQILAVDHDSTRQIIILDKGSKDKVYVGQPVLDTRGVVGQIIDVGYITSTVLLISDAKSAIPVRNKRTGEYGILFGINEVNTLMMNNLPRTAMITKGDLLVTSGLGRLYPEGYPVGYVEEIQQLPGDAFSTVVVRPVALLNRNRLLLLIWPDKQYVSLSSQIKERLSKLEASK